MDARRCCNSDGVEWAGVMNGAVARRGHVSWMVAEEKEGKIKMGGSWRVAPWVGSKLIGGYGGRDPAGGQEEQRAI